MVQVYFKDGSAKRGGWSSPCVILSIDHEAGSIVVTKSGRKCVTATVKDSRAVLDDDTFDTAVQPADDELDSYTDDFL